MKKTEVKSEFEFGFDDLEAMEKIISRCKEKERKKELSFKYVNREKLILRVYIPKIPLDEVIKMDDVESHITYMRVYKNSALRAYLEARRIESYNNLTHGNITWPKRWNNFSTKIIYKTLACDIEGSPGIVVNDT